MGKQPLLISIPHMHRQWKKTTCKINFLLTTFLFIQVSWLLQATLQVRNLKAYLAKQEGFFTSLFLMKTAWKNIMSPLMLALRTTQEIRKL